MTRAKRVSIFGSTGSIGTQTLELVERHPEKFQAVVLTAGRQIERLREQIAKFRPLVVCVATREDAEQLRSEGHPCEIVWGAPGLLDCAKYSQVDIAVMGIVGFPALAPTLELAKHCPLLALANKEVLVAAGEMLRERMRQAGTECVPVDSEHNALFQLLHRRPRTEVARLMITASGGPLYFKKEIDFATVKPEFATQHPVWKMGPKISVDSATLMNKGLELVEAAVLFDCPEDQIEVWVHPQSIVHGAIWLQDGTCLAQMCKPDMKSSIGYALTFPDRLTNAIAPFSFGALQKLEFFDPDANRFPALTLAREAFRAGPSHRIVLNAANEVAVESFLKGQSTFAQIPQVVAHSLEHHAREDVESIETVFAIDRGAREVAQAWISSRSTSRN